MLSICPRQSTVPGIRQSDTELLRLRGYRPEMEDLGGLPTDTLTQLAEGSDLDAMMTLGHRLRSEGSSAMHENPEATRWFEAALDAGRGEAALELATMAAVAQQQGGKGYDVPDEEVWLRRGSQLGDAAASYRIGVMRSLKSLKDEGTDDDAVAWFSKAADGGHAKAMAELGKILMNREAGEATDVRAAELLRNAYEQERIANAAYDLGQLRFWQKRTDPMDPDGALFWVGTADLEGSPEASGLLTHMGVSNYKTADGHEVPNTSLHEAWKGDAGSMMVVAAGQVRRDEIEGDNGAIDWLRKAHEAGDPEAALQLVLIRRDRGEIAGPDGADAWAQKAIDRGDPRGFNELGITRYFAGEKDGDDDSALAWYRKAAAMDLVDAFYNIGEVREEQGRIDSDDDDGAVFWYQKASAAGHPEAAERLAKLD